MRIIVAKNYKELSVKAASILAAEIVLNPECVLGLSTGSTPIGTYGQLVEWYERGELDFSKVSTVNLDEYVGLSGEDEQSYRYFMNKYLFDRINIEPSNTHLPDGMAADSQKECEKFEETIQKLGGIDVQMMGIGFNGHIGFNEPDLIFRNNTHVTPLDEVTVEANKRFFDSADDVPKLAYTMGVGTIMRGKKLLMLVSGEGKAEIVAKAFGGEIDPQVPASILQVHPDVTIVGDEAALSKLLCK